MALSIPHGDGVALSNPDGEKMALFILDGEGVALSISHREHYPFYTEQFALNTTKGIVKDIAFYTMHW